MVVRGGAETSQAAGYFGGRRFHSGICRVTQDADTAIDGDRAGCPSVLSIPAKPAVRFFVVVVGRVEESHQDVHVKEGDAHASSRNSFTIRRSGFETPAFGTKSKAPLRTFRGARAASDCRASCEMSCPSVTPCCRANCLVVVRRSSSSSNVVRILSCLLYTSDAAD